MTLNIEPYESSDDEYTRIYRIKSTDDIITMLEDHLVQLYAMKGSKYDINNMVFDNWSSRITMITKCAGYRYISIFAKEADIWTKGLALVMDVVDMAITVQRQYLYAEVSRVQVYSIEYERCSARFNRCAALSTLNLSPHFNTNIFMV